MFLMAATMADQKGARAFWIPGLDKRAQTGLLSFSAGLDLYKVPPSSGSAASARGLVGSSRAQPALPDWG